MAMLTPAAQYAPHDLPMEQMSPLSLGTSRLPAAALSRHDKTLPSLSSLNLITPPHSASQQRENSFHSADHDSQPDDFDMRLIREPKYSTRSSPPLFMEPEVDMRHRPAPPVSFEQALAQHQSKYEEAFQSGRVKRPTQKEYALAWDFRLHLKSSYPARSEHYTGDSMIRKRRRDMSGPRSRPKIELAMPSMNTDFVHTGFRAVNHDQKYSRPIKIQKQSSMKVARISETPIYRERDTSEEQDYELTPKRTPKKRASASSNASSREPKHARNKSTKVKRSSDHTDYPDYGPPFQAMMDPTTHAEQMRILSIKNPIDLENDPLRNELHQAELIAAKNLNISCAVYLCTKRQIFEGYVEHLRGSRQGNWNKTAAQNVVNLDVTKASALWQFYNDIGWFDKNLFTQYLSGSPE